jgi:hypothetical protein
VNLRRQGFKWQFLESVLCPFPDLVAKLPEAERFEHWAQMTVRRICASPENSVQLLGESSQSRMQSRRDSVGHKPFRSTMHSALEFSPQVLYYPSMTPYDAYRQSGYSWSPVYHATPNNYNEITNRTKYGDAVFSIVLMLPSLHTAGTIAHDEGLISPFSMCYAISAGLKLCQQQQQAQSQSGLPNGLTSHIPRWITQCIYLQIWQLLPDDSSWE